MSVKTGHGQNIKAFRYTSGGLKYSCKTRCITTDQAQRYGVMNDTCIWCRPPDESWSSSGYKFNKPESESEYDV